MNMNVLRILESCPFFEFYFKNRNYILKPIILALILCGLLIIVILRLNCENLRKSSYKKIFFKDTIRLIGILLVGACLNVVGMDLNLNLRLNYMPMLLFFYGFIFVTFIQVIEMIQYKNTYKKILKRTLNIYVGMVDGILLLLILMGRLEVIEFIVSIFSIIILKELELILDNERINIENKDISKEDCPIEEVDQLFASRQRQLDSFYTELKQFQGERESYAVIISGKWGTGKTSFVNAFEKKTEKAEFVHVRCVIGCDAKAILDDIALRIMDIFTDNGIYVSRNGIIEQYFGEIAEFANDMGYSKFGKILNRFGRNKEKDYLEIRKELNNELEKFYKKTKKTIYFIIDDMDRIIDKDMRSLLFQVIRESVALEHCITLFMVDYDQLISENMGREFLEKYVNDQYELCNVTYDEIIELYLKKFLNDEFYSEISDFIRKQRDIIRKTIQEMGIQINKKLLEKIEKLEDSTKIENSEVNVEDRKEKIEVLEEMRKNINRGMSNPRKVKRYLSNIEKMFFVADLVWFQKENFQNNEYSRETWIKDILQIAFVKVFFQEEYADMIQAREFYNFKTNKKSSFIVEQIIEDYNSSYIDIAIGEQIAEKLVYQLYILDVEIDKTEHQRLMEEVNSGHMYGNHIEAYIQQCMKSEIEYDILNKVLDFIEGDKVTKKEYCYNGIVESLKSINISGYDLHNQELYKVIERIKSIIDKFKENNELEDETLEEIEYYINRIEMQFIFRNNGNIRGLLRTFNCKDVIDAPLEEIENVDTATGLYNKIEKINQKMEWVKLDAQKTEIENLCIYFEKMKVELQQEEFSYIKEEGMYFLEPVLSMFKILNVLKHETKKDKDLDLKSIDFEKFTDMKDKLNKIYKDTLDKNELKIVKEQFLELVIKIEEENIMGNYSRKEQNELILLIKNMYKKINSRMYYRSLNENLKNIKFKQQEPEDEWKYCKIRIFRIERKINQGEYN